MEADSPHHRALRGCKHALERFPAIEWIDRLTWAGLRGLLLAPVPHARQASMRSSATPTPAFSGRRPQDGWLYYALMGLALGLVLATAIISLRSTGFLRQSIALVGKTQQVMRAGYASEAAMDDVGTALRDYLERPSRALALAVLSADQQMLEKTRLLGLLANDSVELNEMVLQLSESAQTRSATSRAIVTAPEPRAPNNPASQADALLDAAAARILRSSVRSIRGVHIRRLEARRATMVEQLDRTRDTIIIAGGLAALSGALGLWLLRRSRIAWQRQVVAEIEASRAQRENEEKSMFLANISHEIRTPMNAIFGFSQLLGDVATGERERHYARSITSAGRALLSLINDILDLTKIEAGKLEIEAVALDPRELLESSLVLFAQLAAEKGLTLRSDVAGTVPAQLLADPLRLGQVMTNLVANAVKYTDSGGVLVRMWSAATVPPPAMNLHLSVEDSGIGIASGELERIFQPFVQTGGIGPRREGTGLGLSISRRLVELMGGQIRVASEPQRGSVFEVVVPYDPEAAAVAAAPTLAAALRPNALPPLKLLIVDDVALNRELMVAIFDGSHHAVIEAADGVEAIVLIRREMPDVVLMDVRMPIMDGATALARVRDDHTLDSVKLIAVTASSLHDEERGLRRKFDGYLRKPFTREEMVAEIARVLRLPIAAALARTVPAAHARSNADSDAGVAPDAGTGSETKARVAFAPQVAETLAEMAGARWHELTRSLAMRDIGAFADEVAALATPDTLPALNKWAQRLRQAVLLFDVTTAESVLGRFPTHLRESGIQVAKENSA